MVSLVKLAAAAVLVAGASARTIDVDVGNGGFTFSPDSLTAAKGDIVRFNFFPANHSAIRGNFSNPCQPAEVDGFSSGFVPTSGQSPMMFSVTINDTDPIAVYCGQPELSHCQQGMVLVINPNSQDSLAAYKKGASNSNEPGIPDGGMAFGGSFSTVGNSDNSSNPTSTSTSSASQNSSGNNLAESTPASSTPNGQPGANSMLQFGAFGTLAAALLTAAML